MPRLLALSLTAVLALGLTACGDKKLSRDALVKKAEGICGKYSKKISQLPQPSGANAGTLKSYFAKAQGLADDQQSDLAKLKPASEVKNDWNAFLDQDKQGTQLLGQLADAADKKDTKSATSLLKKITAVDLKIDSTARKVGAAGCGSGANARG